MSPSPVCRLTSLAVLAGLAACLGPAEPSQPGVGELQIYAAVNVPAISTLVIKVTALDLTDPLVFNLELVEGVASGTVAVPAGRDRTITVRAYDEGGVETHEGHVTVDVRPGANPTVRITLLPRVGDQPIEIILGSFAVAVEPAQASLAEGATLQMEATVTDVDGTVVAGTQDVVWATDAPAVATVSAAGLVTARRAGSARIIASFGGVASAGEIIVGGPESALAVIQVSAVASGPDQPLSYGVCVDDVLEDDYCSYEGAFGDGSSTYAFTVTLSPGTYSVSLYHAGNCYDAEPNPRMVTIAPGSFTEVLFPLTCVALGNLLVTATFNGADGTGTPIEVCLDGYDYELSLCSPGTYSGPLPLLIQRVMPGPHTVWWVGAEASAPCTVVGHGQVVNVPSGGTAEAHFEYSCPSSNAVSAAPGTRGASSQ